MMAPLLLRLRWLIPAGLGALMMLFSPVALAWEGFLYPPDGAAQPLPEHAGKTYRSMTEAVSAANKAEEPGVLVVMPGVYSMPWSIGSPSSSDDETLPRLVIRAAQPRSVVVDAAITVTEKIATPDPDHPGVHIVRCRQNWGSTPSSVWEPDRRQRYMHVLDLEAVRAFSGTWTRLDIDRIAIHTVDSRPLNEARVQHDFYPSAISVKRSNVTLQGLDIRHGAVGLEVRDCCNVQIEDCAFSGSTTGLAFIKCFDSAVRHSTFADLGQGILSHSDRITVEHCRLDKGRHWRDGRDLFLPPVSNPQDDAGIQFYSPAGDGIVRGNFITGFHSGVFVKCGPAKVLVEHNTIVGANWGTYHNDWGASGSKFRHNILIDCNDILCGFSEGFTQFDAGNEWDHNLVWPDTPQSRHWLSEMRRMGSAEHCLVADPAFVDAPRGDYRVLARSPAVKLGAEGRPAGSESVMPAEFACSSAPHLEVTLAAPASLGNGDYIDPQAPQVVTWVSPARTATLLLNAQHSTSPIQTVRLQIDDEAPQQMAFTEQLPVTPADREGRYQVQVANAQGVWSQPVRLRVIRADQPPRIVGQVSVSTSDHGAVLEFQTDRPAVANVVVVPAASALPPVDPDLVIQRQYEKTPGPTLRHVVPVRFAMPGDPVDAMEPGASFSYRIRVQDSVGSSLLSTRTGRFTLNGPPRTWYVAVDGVDSPGRGLSPQEPLATPQWALDRALAGDTVELSPGLYRTGNPNTLYGGGRPGAPITIQARQPNTVTLDGLKQVSSHFALMHAPWVVIRNINMRWFRGAGVYVDHSPHVTIAYGRFINDPWPGVFSTGRAARFFYSPHGTFDHNICARMEEAGYFLHSPAPTVTHNSVSAIMYGGVALIYSVRDAVVQHNAFAYTGNDAANYHASQESDFDTAVIDHNVYAADVLGYLHNLKVEQSDPLTWQQIHQEKLTPSQGYFQPSKAVIAASFQQPQKWSQRFLTMQAWQQWRGKDVHSKFADPQWVDPANDRWELRPESPLIGAGEQGQTIGAIETTTATTSGTYEQSQP